MSRKSSNHTPHEEAVAIIEKLAITNLGGHLEATAACNQCSEELTIDLVAGVSSVSREKLMGKVRPDISPRLFKHYTFHLFGEVQISEGNDTWTVSPSTHWESESGTSAPPSTEESPLPVLRTLLLQILDEAEDDLSDADDDAIEQAFDDAGGN